MKRIYVIILGLMLAIGVNVQAQSFDLQSILKGVQSKTGNGSDAIGSVLGQILGTKKVSPADLVGTWKYTAPAVAFESDNFLQKAGGAAASATIENKLSPYYTRAGLQKLVLTVQADSTFTMQIGRGSLSGTITSGEEEGYLVFNFTALKKVKVGSVRTGVQLAGNNLSLTFDISKLMTVVNTIAKVSGNSTISGVNKLLQSYDGMQAGFKLARQPK